MNAPLDRPPERRVEAGGDERTKRERELLCRRCEATITRSTLREDDGPDALHTFVNPAGVVFHVQRYLSAPGARPLGVPSREFSWFPECTWQVAVCRGCSAHIGWFFSGAAQFYGLIVDRLIESD